MAVADSNGACIDDNGDDSVVGIGAGGEILILGRRWTPHGRDLSLFSPWKLATLAEVPSLLLLYNSYCCCYDVVVFVVIVLWMFSPG